MITLTPEYLAELWQRYEAAKSLPASNAEAMLINADAWRLFPLLLDEVERLTRDLTSEEEESEHYLRLAFPDPGANPPVSWKDRAKSAETEVERMREALRPFADWIKHHDGLANGTRLSPNTYRIGGYGPTLGELRQAAAASKQGSSTEETGSD